MDGKKLGKINYAVLAFFIFGIIGVIARLFMGPIDLGAYNGLMYQFGIVAVPFGLVGGIFAYNLPNIASAIFDFIFWFTN